MKTLVVFACLLMMLMASCQSSDESTEATLLLLNEPYEEVMLTVLNETFTVDFSVSCLMLMDDLFMSKWTRDSLIHRYKEIKPYFSPGFMNQAMWQDQQVSVYEYLLAQECFSDLCSSKIREEVLRLVINIQKAKYDEYVYLGCAIKTGVFLMAVILVKERENSAKFIDAATLQKALLFLSYDNYDMQTFSDLIIDSSEKFLIDKK